MIRFFAAVMFAAAVMAGNALSPEQITGVTDNGDGTMTIGAVLDPETCCAVSGEALGGGWPAGARFEATYIVQADTLEMIDCAYALVYEEEAPAVDIPETA